MSREYLYVRAVKRKRAARVIKTSNEKRRIHLVLFKFSAFSLESSSSFVELTWICVMKLIKENRIHGLCPIKTKWRGENVERWIFLFFLLFLGWGPPLRPLCFPSSSSALAYSNEMGGRCRAAAANESLALRPLLPHSRTRWKDVHRSFLFLT